jgi:tryptophan halogenase
VRYDAFNPTLCDLLHIPPVSVTRLHQLTGPAAEAANRLLDLSANIPLAGIERSCKFGPGTLSRERLLLGQTAALMAGTSLDAAPRFLKLPPSAKLPYMQDRLRANFIYLGFDGGDSSLSYRIYLEFPVNLARQRDAATGQMAPALLARGYKWDALRPERDHYDATDYWWHPRLAVDQIHMRLQALWAQQPDGTAGIAQAPAPDTDDQAMAAAQTLVKRTIDLARQRSNALDWQYLEVTEPASARHSFDLNVYNADLRMAELTNEIRALGQALGIADTETSVLLAETAESTLGHVSGGVGRDGRPFLTVYYADQDEASAN